MQGRALVEEDLVAFKIAVSHSEEIINEIRVLLARLFAVEDEIGLSADVLKGLSENRCILQLSAVFSHQKLDCVYEAPNWIMLVPGHSNFEERRQVGLEVRAKDSLAMLD